MMIAILGAGDITKLYRFGKLKDRKAVDKMISDVAKLLAEKKAELVIIPARGVPYETAKLYNEYGGVKVTGLVPRGDKRYGIEHIKKYMGIIDEEISFNSWYDLNGEVAAKADLAVVLGFSAGVMTEISMLKYHYKYLRSKTKLVIFKNTISAPLHKEITEDLRDIYYIDSVKELGEIIDSLKV